MSKKTRFKIEIKTNQKQKFKDTLTSQFNAKNISFEKNKRGELFILFSIKNDVDEVNLLSWSDTNKIKICKNQKNGQYS